MAAKIFVPAALLAGMVVLTITAGIAAVTHEPLSLFTRDVTVGAQTLPYVGMVSVFNQMVWASAGALSLLAAYLVPARRRWFQVFGALLLLFAADDALQLHESVGPYLGVPESAFYAVYAVIAMALLWRVLRRRPVKGSAFAFLLGGALLGISLSIDVFLEGQAFAEDAAKLLGALVWLTVPLLVLPRRRRRATTTDFTPRRTGVSRSGQLV
jgi:hypothetical protein